MIVRELLYDMPSDTEADPPKGDDDKDKDK